MLIKKKPMPRRTFIRGAGATIALPFLNIMQVSESVASTLPKVMFCYVPCGWGRYLNEFFYDKPGPITSANAPRYIKPLLECKDDFTIIKGLYNECGDYRKYGAGEHARGSGTYLTARPALKDPAVAKCGISIDHFIAKELLKKGESSRLGVLNTGFGPSFGNDSGYNPQTMALNWLDENQPIAWQRDCKTVFNQLYQNNSTNNDKKANEIRVALRKSMLDNVMDQTKKLQNALGAVDKRKLDQYLTGIREVEQSLSVQVASPSSCELPNSVTNSNNNTEHFRCMTELVLLALQCDLTRVATYACGCDGTDTRPMNDGAWHTVSHYKGDSTRNAQYGKICNWVSERCLEFIKNAKSKGLLDNTLICFGSGTGGNDSQSHGDTDLRTLLIGSGNGINQKLGQSVDLGKVQHADMLTTMAHAAGVPIQKYGEFGTGNINNALSSK